jgi:hypothetical protein
MLKNPMWILVLSLLNPIPLFAGGSYYVGQDAGGVYFQTDQDGGWYIDRQDLKFFKIGETGTYSIGKDPTGTYLSTDGKPRFYLDMEARSKIVKETKAFNAAEEKRLRDLGEGENKHGQKPDGKEAVDQGDKQAPHPVKVEITVTSQEYDDDNGSKTYFIPGYDSYRRPKVHPGHKDPLSPKARPLDRRPVTPGFGTGEFPWWKGSLHSR